MDSVESKVLVVAGVEGPPHHSGLHFVLFFRQKLEFHVGIAAGEKERGNYVLRWRESGD